MSSILFADSTYDGSVNSSARYSLYFLRSSGYGVSIIAKVANTASVVALTVQCNPDADTTTADYGWIDDPRIGVYDMTAGATLGKTNAGILSSASRGGILTATTGTHYLFMEFTPVSMFYRLRIDITTSSAGTFSALVV